jgi:hypothetical protein
MSKRQIYLASFLGVVGLAVMATTGAADPSLIGWWKLDDGAGTTAADSSGKGNQGTLQGDASFVAAGHFRGAVLLDGNGDYVECGRSDVFNVSSAVTLAAWVQADPGFTYPDWSGIIMRGGPDLDTFAIYYNGPGKQIGFKLTGTSASWHAVVAAGLFDWGWHYVAGTYDGSTKAIYLDGEILLSAGNSGTAAKNANVPLLPTLSIHVP